MQLVVLGLNHKTAPVHIREGFALTEEKIRVGLKHVDEYDQIYEIAILSTCNRSEIYAVVEDVVAALRVLQMFWYHLVGNEEDINDYLFYHKDEECIDHLFRVASSLDSLVLGESQILSQVKNAYALAREAETVSTVLNTLFHRAIAVGKRVRTETRIAYSAVSVSYAAVEMARNNYGDLFGATILLVGAGQMAELTAKHFVARGVRKVYVANRSFERAAELADKFNGEAVPFENAVKNATSVDIIVTSTGAPHYVVKAWETSQLMTRRKGRPLLFIDIAVPRDVEPEVVDIKGVKLYNIDDLESIVDSNIKFRKEEAKQAEKIIKEETLELVNKFRYLSFRPVMVLLTDKAERIRIRELKRAMAKLSDLGQDERRAVENMSKMIVRKILREPMMRINNSAGTGNEQFYVDAMCDLFKLDTVGVQEDERESDYRYARQ